jgi:hypothetical protein
MEYQRWGSLSSGEVFTMPRKTRLEGESSESRPRTTRRRSTSVHAVEAPAPSPGLDAGRGAGLLGGSALEPMTRPTDEEIRTRAYMIYLSRNGAPGDPVADWLQAERELNALMRGEPMPWAGSRGPLG